MINEAYPITFLQHRGISTVILKFVSDFILSEAKKCVKNKGKGIKI